MLMFTEPGEFCRSSSAARSRSTGWSSDGDRPCHQGWPAGDERDDHARQRRGFGDRRSPLRSAPLLVRRPVGHGRRLSRCQRRASELVRELESQLLDARARAPRRALRRLHAPAPRERGDAVDALRPARHRASPLSRPQPPRRSHVNDHFDHPAGRGARRHARVPRRQPDRRRLPGADRARPGEGARAAEHGAPGPDPGRRQRADARAARRDPLRRGARRPRRSRTRR